MPVITRKRSAEFAIIPNQVSEDDRLSFEASGLLCYLLAKPNSWKVQVKDIQRRGGIGRDKAYRLLNELIKTGYIERTPKRDDAGKITEHEYVVYDCAVPATLPLPENADVAELLPENPEVDTPDPENTEVGEPLPENTTSGKSGRSSKNEYIIKPNSPLPPTDKREAEIRFDTLWKKLPQQQRPKSRDTAQSIFLALSARDQVDAVEYFEAYRNKQFWDNKHPQLITYLKTRAWLPLKQPPEKDEEGYFIIPPWRPEWRPWIDDIEATKGSEAAAKAKRWKHLLVRSRWPTTPVPHANDAQATLPLLSQSAGA